MIRFLADLLTPVFGSYGVSPVDVQTYADMLSGYIYAIFGTLLLAAAVMVAAHWLVKKGTRHVVRWSAGLAWVLIVTVLTNVICFGPMYNNIAPIPNIQGSVSEAPARQTTPTPWIF